MPRAFDSDYADAVTFIENVECPGCGTVDQCLFRADATTVEDLTDAPSTGYTCPTCGAQTEVTFTGWTLYTEAG